MSDEVKEVSESPEQQCIFCKIIKNEIPSKKVYEDEIVSVILDINPANLGHLLVLPKQHYAIMPQIPGKELAHMFKIAKHMSNCLLKAMSVKGTTIFAANGAGAGQKAPHFMIHVIPRSEGDGLFDIPKKDVNEADLEKIKEMIIIKLKEKLGRDPVQRTEKPKEELKEETKKEQKFEKEVVEEKPKKKEPKKKIEKKEEEVDIDKLTDMLLK